MGWYHTILPYANNVLLLWLPRRPSVQRDVTKQFIKRHTHKDPYPGAPYKVLPELAAKYNLVTEVSGCHDSIIKLSPW